MTLIARRDLPHVLVVGDSDALRIFARRAASARCTVVRRAKRALAIVRRSTIDAAVVDLSSAAPRDGLRLVGRLCDEQADLAVVVISAAPGVVAAAEALRVGVFDWLVPPAAPDEIEAAVDRALGSGWTTRAADAHDRRGRDMRATMAAVGASFIDSGIASTAALESCVAVLFRRNPLALLHTRRVAAASVRTAASLGIGEPMRGQIERAALLHDAGRIAIPADLLDSPHPWTVDERELAGSHVRLTAAAMMASPFLAPSAPIVLAVRERFDGTGDPNGLRGEAIPIGARIIAVAKAFDAVQTGGFRSQPASPRAAAARLVLEAGSRFDPQVVRAFLGWLDAVGDAPAPAARAAGGWYRCS